MLICLEIKRKQNYRLRVWTRLISLGIVHFLLVGCPYDICVLQTLSDAKKPGIMVELQKLVSEWPLEVIKHQKDEDRKVQFHIIVQFLPT